MNTTLTAMGAPEPNEPSLDEQVRAYREAYLVKLGQTHAALRSPLLSAATAMAGNRPNK